MKEIEHFKMIEWGSYTPLDKNNNELSVSSGDKFLVKGTNDFIIDVTRFTENLKGKEIEFELVIKVK